jgi:hypothetical protein
MNFITAIMFAHMSSDPAIVGPSTDVTPFSAVELENLVRSVVARFDEPS